MIWASWADFFAMGGYAFYVWGSVLMVTLCIVLELVTLRLRSKNALRLAKAVNKSSKPNQSESSQ